MENLAADFIIDFNNPIEAEFELSEGGYDCSFELFASGTVWGSISGELSNQTDLQNALDLKADKTELNTAVSELNTAIQNEATTRAENDTLLQNNINTLSQTVTANYNTLDGKIDTEISDRTASDTTLQGNIDTLSGTVTSNYNALDARITTNTGNISDINTTLSGYGNIVTHNVSEFATSAQGALADTALQPNDNISELVNDVGYITSASLPTDYVPETRTINGYALSSNITLNYTDVGALSASTTINDLTTIAQQNALNSGATTTNIGQITTNANNIADIQDLIPNQASSSNQLADKDFVNSSIATNTANFIGTFNSVAELEAYTGTLTNNDYAFVATTDAAGNTLYDRYKYNADTQEWLFEYELNNSSFTAVQWASINSGATSTNIGQITINANNIADLQTNKQNTISDLSTIRSGAALGATSLQPNDNISELTNDANYITSADLPTNYVTTNTAQTVSGNKTFTGVTKFQNGSAIGCVVLGADVLTTSVSNNQRKLGRMLFHTYENSVNCVFVSVDSETTRNSVEFGGRTSDKINTAPDVLRFTVANSHNSTTSKTHALEISYTDGANFLVRPKYNSVNLATVNNIPTDTNDLTNGAGYITGITSSDVTTALGYTPYNSSNPSGYISSASLSTLTDVNLTNLSDGQTIVYDNANSKWINATINSATWGNITGTLSNQTDLQNALDAKYDASNPNGYTSNVGTVTSVNNVTPVNGNVTLSIPSISNLADKDLSNLSATGEAHFQAPLVSGTNIKTINNNSILGSGDIAISGRNIGEIVESSIPLTDAGLHLLDGALINGSGIYSDFVDYIANIYKTKDRVYNPSAFTVVGSPTITDDGIASGFSSSDYITNNLPALGSQPFKIVTKVNTGEAGTNRYICKLGTSAYRSALIINKSNNLTFWTVVNDGNNTDVTPQYYNIPANTDLFVKVEWDGNYYWVSISYDGETWLDGTKKASTYPLVTYNQSGIYIGYLGTSTGDYASVSIDLKQFSIAVNGVEVFSGSNPANYFTTEAEWQTSVATYGVCGKFVYDSVNNTVRLPKVTGIIEGTTDVSALGDLIEAGLPNITGNFYAEAALGNPTGAFYAGNNPYRGSASGSANNQMLFDASRSSSIYGNSTTVQPQTIKVLYYIVVATSTKTDIEVDIDNVVTDLNGKADVDLTNATDQAKILMGGMAMPSDRYINLTLGASGTTYIAPANGWISLAKAANGNNQSIAIQCSNLETRGYAPTSGASSCIYCPVKKGDNVKILYSVGGETYHFRFVYAVGSESEAS